MKLAILSLVAGCTIYPPSYPNQTRSRDFRAPIASTTTVATDDSAPTPAPDPSPPDDPFPPRATDSFPVMVFTPDGSIEQATPIGAGMYQPMDGGAPVMGTPAN